MSLSKLGSWRWTGRTGMLGFMGLQGVGHDWVTELNWTEDDWGDISVYLICISLVISNVEHMFTKEHISSSMTCLFSSLFFLPCCWQRIYLLIPKKQNSEKHLPPPLQEELNKKTFSGLLCPLPRWALSTCTLSQSWLTSRDCRKGTWPVILLMSSANLHGRQVEPFL